MFYENDDKNDGASDVVPFNSTHLTDCSNPSRHKLKAWKKEASHPGERHDVQRQGATEISFDPEVASSGVSCEQAYDKGYLHVIKFWGLHG